MPNGLAASTPAAAVRRHRRDGRRADDAGPAEVRRQRRADADRGGAREEATPVVEACSIVVLVVHVVVHTFLVECFDWTGETVRKTVECSLPRRCTCKSCRFRIVSCQAADPAAVAVFERVVVFVTSWNVRRDVDRRDRRPPRRGVPPPSIVSSWAMNAAVIEETAPTPMPSAVDGHRRVAERCEVVDHHVGDLAEALAAGVLRRDGVGVLEAGDGDHLVAALLGLAAPSRRPTR